MPVKLSSTGGGSVTLDTPSTASNLTVTLPSASGTLATTSGTGSVFTNPTINGFTGDTSVVNIGSGQFYKDTSGNVGIGTSSPAYKLDVLGVINARSASGATVQLYSTAGTDQGNVIGSYYNSGANFAQIGFSAAYYTFGVSGTERMRLDSSGNLGLGGAPKPYLNPNYTAVDFQSGRTALMASSSTPQTNLLTNAYYGTSWQYSQTGYAASNYMQQSGVHSWYTAPSGTAGNAISFTQAMTLDASGNLLVGVTSSTATPAKGFVATSSGNAQIAVGHDTGALSGYYYASFAYNGSAIGSITQSGTTAVAYNTSSDQRLKENIVDAPSALSSVNAIKVRSFDWKSDGSHVDYGYIAQELLDVVPEAVTAPEDPDEMMGVDFGKLTPRLVKAIQELSAKNSELESRLAALEGK